MINNDVTKQSSLQSVQHLYTTTRRCLVSGFLFFLFLLSKLFRLSNNKIEDYVKKLERKSSDVTIVLMMEFSTQNVGKGEICKQISFPAKSVANFRNLKY
jgi:hypothetical protein